MNITITPLDKSDFYLIKQISDISEAAFSRFGSYGNLIEEVILDTPTIAGVLYVDSQMAGFVLLAFSKIQSFQEDSHGKLYKRLNIPQNTLRQDIWAIALKPEFRGQKLGNYLMQWALDIAEIAGVGVVHLTVGEGNERAIALFKKHGFDFEDCVDAGTYPTGIKARYMYKIILKKSKGH